MKSAKAVERVTITIPPPLLNEIERIRRRTGETRSAVFRRIVRFSFEEMKRRERIRRDRRGYRAMPETGDEPLPPAEVYARLWDDEAPYG